MTRQHQWVAGCTALFAACALEQIELLPQGASEQGTAAESAGAPPSCGTGSFFRCVDPVDPALPRLVSFEPAGEAIGSGGNVGEGEGAGAVDAGPSEVLSESSLQFCSKLDLLFVVDNSRSMRDEQGALAATFPGLLNDISTGVGIDDVHVMVVDTDDESVLRSVPEEDTCEGLRGAGLVLDEGGEPCGVPTGQRFLEANAPLAPEAFACLAQVGSDGAARERPIESLLAALGPEEIGPNGCNRGFLRDDSVLVVTLVTDEDDDRSNDDPLVWLTQLAALLGEERAASTVLLGLFPQEQSEFCGDERDDPSPRLREFFESFQRSLTGDVCAPDYRGFFAESLDVVADACRALPVLSGG